MEETSIMCNMDELDVKMAGDNKPSCTCGGSCERSEENQDQELRTLCLQLCNSQQLTFEEVVRGATVFYDYIKNGAPE